MAIVKLVPTDTGASIEVDNVDLKTTGLFPISWPAPVIAKRIVETWKNYEVWGTKGTSTTRVLLAKVPYGQHIEVHQ